MKQLILNARGCSGRGVRIRTLAPEQRANVLESTAKLLGGEATWIELRLREAIAGVCAMVAEITESGGYLKRDDLFGPSVQWKKVNAEHLTDRYGDYFVPKDVDALIKIFRTLHDVTETELENILGEALDVTED